MRGPSRETHSQPRQKGEVALVTLRDRTAYVCNKRGVLGGSGIRFIASVLSSLVPSRPHRHVRAPIQWLGERGLRSADERSPSIPKTLGHLQVAGWGQGTSGRAGACLPATGRLRWLGAAGPGAGEVAGTPGPDACVPGKPARPGCTNPALTIVFVFVKSTV